MTIFASARPVRCRPSACASERRPLPATKRPKEREHEEAIKQVLFDRDHTASEASWEAFESLSEAEARGEQIGAGRSATVGVAKRGPKVYGSVKARMRAMRKAHNRRRWAGHGGIARNKYCATSINARRRGNCGATI
jgi:hypothetical protein